jgi:hypothetical protein
MKSLTLTLAVWISLVSMVSASLAPRKEPRLPPRPNLPTVEKQAPPVRASLVSARVPDPAAEESMESEFVVTEQTEIWLDGKPCKYPDVAPHARIMRMEVAADRKTVLKIHFRTRK